MDASDYGRRRPSSEFVEIVKTVAYALVIAFVIRVLLFQPFTIPSGSMEPTLFQGDYIIVSKYAYGYSRHSLPFSPPLFSGRVFARQPHRGDVDNTGVYVVPQGQYFFMGDNRDNSQDSRFPEAVGVGYVPFENLVGKADLVLLSWNDKASLFKPWTWFVDARPSRFFKLVT